MKIDLDPNDPHPFKSGNSESTSLELTCELCGTVHNEGFTGDDGSENYVLYVNFGGITVADCCFDKLEKGVYDYHKAILDWIAWMMQRKITTAILEARIFSEHARSLSEAIATTASHQQ